MTLVDILPTPTGISRRQALKVVAAVAAVPAAIGGVRLLAPDARFHVWAGEALGAASSMMIWHPNANFAQATIQRMLSEVARLDTVFSLFRSDSELSRLNEAGAVSGVSRDFIAVMESARDIAEVSSGAFDPTVQPLWDVYASHFAVAGADPRGPSPESIDAARSLVGYDRIDLGSRSIAFAAPGMSATLNGIAQGYITDRIADLLRNEGFEHVVVELGETRVLGDHPEGRPWRVGLRDQIGATDRMMDLNDGALAMSGGYGTVFDPSGRNHHLFDPATGRSAESLVDVVVASPRAMEADALATALFVAGETRARDILAAYPGASAILTRHDGSAARL